MVNPSTLRRLAKGLAFLGLAVLGVAASFSRSGEVFAAGQVFFLDPDCYSRMTRVALMEEGQMSLQSHSFENAPYGTVPHTTAPMDWSIFLLGRTFALFGIGNSRDLAGALISPLFGLAFFALIALFLYQVPYGWCGLLLLAVSPIIGHAFAAGRPDHQSMVLLFCTAGYLFWPDRVPNHLVRCVLSAFFWAVALWVSLFEPLILLLGLCGLMAFQQRSWPKIPIPALVVFFATLGFALAFDGWRFSWPDQEMRHYFPKWAESIGELHGASFSKIVAWSSFFAPLVPLLLIWRARAKGEDSRLAISAATLLLVFWVLTLDASRWGYFLVVATALSLPVALSSVPWGKTVVVAFLLSLWPVAADWDRSLFPSGEQLKRRNEQIAEGWLLRDLASRIPPNSTGTILAPWWLSPALAYWSGIPCVAGSSHQSLPGTLDASRFYLSQSSAEGEEVLRKRKVQWVIVDDPDRTVTEAQSLLGPGLTNSVMAVELFRGRAPGFLHRIARNPYFSLYQVQPEDKPN